MRVRLSRSLIAVSSFGFVGTVGCVSGISDGPPEATNTVPVINIALNRSYTANSGLDTDLEAHGWPNRDIASPMDPTVIEARKFYDTLRAPNVQPEMVDYPDPFTGQLPGPRMTAPLTFQA
jgi:hypothetical protein